MNRNQNIHTTTPVMQMHVFVQVITSPLNNSPHTPYDRMTSHQQIHTSLTDDVDFWGGFRNAAANDSKTFLQGGRKARFQHFIIGIHLSSGKVDQCWGVPQQAPQQWIKPKQKNGKNYSRIPELTNKDQQSRWKLGGSRWFMWFSYHSMTQLPFHGMADCLNKRDDESWCKGNQAGQRSFTSCPLTLCSQLTRETYRSSQTSISLDGKTFVVLFFRCHRLPRYSVVEHVHWIAMENASEHSKDATTKMWK